MTFTSRALDAAGVAGPAAAQQANVLWFIPTHGEGRYLATIEAERDVSLPCPIPTAQTADDPGRDGVLLPTGRRCEDTWRGGTNGGHADRISRGRLLVNDVTGGDPVKLKGGGFLDHAGHFAVTDEFLTIWRRLLGGETVSWQGRHLAVEDGRVLPRCRSPTRHAISAARRRPASRSRPGLSTTA